MQPKFGKDLKSTISQIHYNSIHPLVNFLHPFTFFDFSTLVANSNGKFSCIRNLPGSKFQQQKKNVAGIRGFFLEEIIKALKN